MLVDICSGIEALIIHVHAPKARARRKGVYKMSPRHKKMLLYLVRGVKAEAIVSRERKVASARGEEEHQDGKIDT